MQWFPIAHLSLALSPGKSGTPLAGQLAALRMLTNLDRATPAAYCGAYALWPEATEAIQKHGAMVKSPTSYPVQSLRFDRQSLGRD